MRRRNGEWLRWPADINERKISEGRLLHQADFDPLTALPNRALFSDRVQQAMKRAASGKPMALLFLDIDRFKSINDTLGHEAGDQVFVGAHRRPRAATAGRSSNVAKT